MTTIWPVPVNEVTINGCKFSHIYNLDIGGIGLSILAVSSAQNIFYHKVLFSRDGNCVHHVAQEYIVHIEKGRIIKIIHSIE